MDPKLLRPHPDNPNYHPPEQIDQFIAILRYQGWRRPITVSKRSNYVTKGHGALQAALTAGFTLVPVDHQHYADEAQEIADIIADNQLQKLSKMDDLKLQKMMTDLGSFEGFDLQMTGLPMQEIQTLMVAVPGWAKVDEDQLVVPDGAQEVDYQTANDAPQTHAEQTEMSGGPAADQPRDETVTEYQPPAASGHVRMVQLFFNSETVSEFLTNADFFVAKFGVGNMSDAVLLSLRALRAREEPAANG